MSWYSDGRTSCHILVLWFNNHSEVTDKPERNCHLSASGRNCMTHRQALKATAAKIIYTTVQLCQTSCLVLVIVVCVDMVRYTVEQRVFLYEWNVVPLESVGNCFVVNFPGSQFPAHQTSINLLIKPGLLGHFWTRNLIKTPCAYRRKIVRKRGYVRTHTTEISEMPCTWDRHLEIVSSQSDAAVNFILFKRYRVCVCVCACIGT
jgi:hypothetical protein